MESKGQQKISCQNRKPLLWPYKVIFQVAQNLSYMPHPGAMTQESPLLFMPLSTFGSLLVTLFPTHKPSGS